MITLGERAVHELRSHEALVFDWHHVAICCAGAGEISLRAIPGRVVADSSRFRPLAVTSGFPVYAHRQAYPHLANRDVAVDCRRRLGFRQFTSDLPADFGLRACLGRLPPAPSSPTANGGFR